jgi:hypothetical protein
VKKRKSAEPLTGEGEEEGATPRERKAETYLRIGLANLHLLNEAFCALHPFLAFPEDLLHIGACESERGERRAKSESGRNGPIRHLMHAASCKESKDEYCCYPESPEWSSPLILRRWSTTFGREGSEA